MPDEPLRLWEAWKTRGDARAFEDLVRPEIGRAVALAKSEGCPPGEAEDAVQESLVRLAREKSDTPARVGVRGWFFGVVRDRARSRLRSDRRRRRREHEAAVPEAVSGEVPRFALREEVDRALAGLPDEEREALRLRYLLDLEYREVAYVLGVSEGACRMRVLRALKRVRGALGAGAGAALGAVLFPAPARAASWVSAATAAAPVTSGAALGGGVLLMTTAQKVVAITIGAVLLGAAIGAGTARHLDVREAASIREESDRVLDSVRTELREAKVTRDEALQELDGVRRKLGDLEGEVERLRSEPRRMAEVRPMSQPASAPPKDKGSGEIPKEIIDAAAALGVSPATLRAVFDADERLRGSSGRGDSDEAKALMSLGEDGFRALVALLRGGRNGTWIATLFQSLWVPGREQVLLEAAEDASLHPYARSTALLSLGAMDTPKVRDYLVERAGREQDPSAFLGAAQGLARLREPRGAASVEEKLTAEAYSGMRGHLLGALGEMGGADARRILVNYLRDAYASDVWRAIGALNRADPAAAREEAATLLDGPRARHFDSLTLESLRKIAGRN